MSGFGRRPETETPRLEVPTVVLVSEVVAAGSMVTWTGPAATALDSSVPLASETVRVEMVTGAPPPKEKKLRSPENAGFGEIPHIGHQGGSAIALSRYSQNPEAAWIFMQWGCCKEIMTRCTLIGGFAPMRLSSFEDPRVKAKAKVMAGTTRHLETVKWTIDNAIATEPHMPLWAGFSTNELPTELGKLLTGQDYGGALEQYLEAAVYAVTRLPQNPLTLRLPLVALCCLAWILPPCAKPRAADCRSSSISACIVCYTQYNEPPKFFVGLELYQQR